MSKKIYNLIILDESGSMSGLEKVSVDGVNETIQTIQNAQKEHPEQEQFLTFVTFSHRMYGDRPFRVHRDMEPITNVQAYTIQEYRPCGNTPLYDTMGTMLTTLECKVSDEDIVLVTIITDGYENSSREYNSAMIRRLISRLSEKNWVFAYIGANQDAILTAQGMGIRNAMNFDASEEGTRKMWENERYSKRAFMDKAVCSQSAEDYRKLKEDYFKEDNDNEVPF